MELYNKLGIDLSCTVPANIDAKLNEKSTPFTLMQELGLHLSETKMNNSFSNSPQKVEHVKRNIIEQNSNSTNSRIDVPLVKESSNLSEIAKTLLQMSDEVK
jgi:hypothetical protein